MERLRGVSKEQSGGGTDTKALRELGDIHKFTAVPAVLTLLELSLPKSWD